MISPSVTKNVYYTPGFANYILLPRGLPGGTSGKEPGCQCRGRKRLQFIPGLGRSLEKGMATNSSIPVLENPMGREAWCTTGHRVAKSQT